MINLEEIRRRIISGEELEEILEKIDWKEFEEFVAHILEHHDFSPIIHFRFKTKRFYEIDILAVKKDIILAIDCKKWSRGRYKKTGLKYAVDSQEERVEELKKYLKNNKLLASKLGIEKPRFLSLIITWFEEDMLKFSNTLIVPVWKLNNFLLSISDYV